MLRHLTRNRSASPYERARLAAGALTARVHAARRADRLNSRARPHTVAVPTTPSPNLRPGRAGRAGRAGRRAGRDLEPTTDGAAVEQTRRTVEAAAVEMAARIQAGIRERAAARRSRPQPAPATAPPPHAQQPVQPAPGRTTPTGGVA
ncbi:hypothetical protein ACFWSF_34160 [Streptomyces sp. NPDC058611]|uniref:hypothetical protein n=1 Tax=unclassified Streptomyces TaxID=2593676 RepID=UPI00364C182E